MDPARWKKIQELFEEVADLDPSEARMRLSEGAAGDDELRREVELLLACDAESDSRIARVILEEARCVGDESRLDEPAGTVIGPYTVVRLLGEGGFGRVYLAQQSEPLCRSVALKLIKAGVDTRQVVARFEAERHLLARMKHPGIASVLDAGSTSDRRPYIAMEYVEGVSITDFCDARRLGTRSRLELFIDVCRAVQHAHQKGVIHRDIKPSNVLVTEIGGRFQVKIIDFGIATLVDEGAPLSTRLTQGEMLVGTPSYMSPEQAAGRDVDTRTDVYSLGVLLYELLAGEPPFPSSRLRRAGAFEIQRIISEVEPDRPSARAASLVATNPSLARRDDGEARAVARTLRGDLDWITMKALAKEPDRRYGGPDALADDVQRHLRLEAVEAGPPSLAYRAGKFVRRHRAGVAATAFAFVTLAAGLALAAAGSVQAARERDAAEAVTAFLVDLFEVSDPDVAEGETMTARELLDRGARRIREDASQDDATRARLTSVIGRVYRNMGLFDSADPLLVAALEQRRMLLGDRHRDVAESLLELCGLRQAQARFEDAERHCREALEIQRSVSGARSLEAARVLTVLGDTLRQAGDPSAGEAAVRESLSIRLERLPEVSPEVAESRVRLGQMLMDQGGFEEAETELRRSLEIREALHGPEHGSVAQSATSLAVTLHELDRLEEAESYYRRARAIDEKVYGPRHHFIATHINNLAILSIDRGEYDDAAKMLLEALDIFDATVGREHPDALNTLGSLASAYSYLGEHGRAISVLRATEALLDRQFEGDHHVLLLARINLATILRNNKELAESERLFRRILANQEAGPETPLFVATLHGLGSVLADLESPVEAEALVRRALDMSRRVLGPSHVTTLRIRTTIAALRARANDFEEAVKEITDAREALEESLPEGHFVVEDARRLEARIAESAREADAADGKSREP